MRVYLGTRAVSVKASQSLGKGGEADIFDIGGGVALKLFKGPHHPDLAGSTVEQAAAEARLDLQQQKLPAFPLNLPPHVVVPMELARERPAGRIVGYSMRRVDGALPLCALGSRAGCPGRNEDEVVAVLRDLHLTVAGLHRLGVVIGDFNDLNVLVRGAEAFVIDADSFQFGPYPCPVFTLRFTDPRHLALANGAVELSRPHDVESDWYAFAVLVMQSLLFADPYAGVHRPTSGARVPELERPLRRLTVFDPEVRYPKPARPLDVLPDDLLAHLQQTFVADLRQPFPSSLLADLRLTPCGRCGLVHGRAVCPACHAGYQPPVLATTTVHGKVVETRVHRSRGRILAASVIDGRLAWLEESEGALRREDGRELVRGTANPDLVVGLLRGRTALGLGGRVVVTAAGGEAAPFFAADPIGRRSMVVANSRHLFWVHDGSLWRDGAFGPERVGEVLPGQTRIFVGERFGLGFYRAADLTVAFTFDAERAGLCDRVELPRWSGQLYDVECVFAAERAWLFLATQEQGQRWHTCVVVRPDGTEVGRARTRAGEGGWLGGLRGKAAAGEILLAATDDGIVRVEISNGTPTETRRFADTEELVHADCRLLALPDGLGVVTEEEIRILHL
jgi:hypothetical protein